MAVPNKNLSRFTHSLWLTLGMFVVFALVFAIYVRSEKQIDLHNELRQRSFLLADELRQSSDDLTRMVRTYVVTGDPVYKQHYREILDIRDGKKPRPVDYHNIYWDLVMQNDQRPRTFGPAVPLLELMRQTGFTEQEFARLAQAKANSDALTNTEFTAMALIEATNPTSETSRLEATRMLNDASYHQAKYGIMKPISEFYLMMDQRTLQSVRAAMNMAMLVRLILILFGLLLIFTLWRAYRALHSSLGCSVDELQQRIARLGSGDFSTAIPVPANMENSVLGWLSETQINLARIEAERKQAETALRQSEERFKTMFNEAPLGIALIDSLSGRIYEVNPMFAKIAGRTLAQMADVDGMSIPHPDDVQDDLDNMALLNAGKISGFQIEKRYLHPDGAVVWINMAIAPLKVEDKTRPRHLCMIADITKRKQAEEQLRHFKDHLEEEVRQRTADLMLARNAAEAANIAKSTFIATMSHELRTPLNAILGFSELMSQDEAATAAQKETLAIINRSGAHLLSMINDVLDISKIEVGRLDLDIQALDLLNLLQDLSDMIGVRAADKQLSFSLEIASELPQYIKADGGKLRQVLINLLGNALKFTQQGEVILRADAQPSTTAEMMMLSIEVADSGVGIAADQQQELFKPFVQLAQENADVKGTGLGLAISKSLVELMGGCISVTSILGVGSIFRVELPVAIASVNDITVEEQCRPVKSIAPDQPQWRLLVVDDSADNRLLLVTLLTEAGFQVREAENGQQAISEFEQWQPHLIWMDMRMPVMDGYEAIAKIRQLEGGDAVKIIALTASAFREQHAKIINAGCDAVLHKPFLAPAIFSILTKCLDVKFIYRDTPTSSPMRKMTAEMLIKLPLELRCQLHEASLTLDSEEADVVIAKIRALAPDVADALQTLVRNYQFEQIIHVTGEDSQQGNA